MLPILKYFISNLHKFCNYLKLSVTLCCQFWSLVTRNFMLFFILNNFL